MDRWSLEKRKDDFMRGIDVEEQRRRLDSFQVNLRMQKRHETQQKRRFRSLTVMATTPVYSEALLAAYPSLGDTAEPYELKVSLMHQLLASPQYQLDTLLALRKLLSGVSDVTGYKPIVEAGIVALLVSFLDWSYSSEIVREAAWCLANLAALAPSCVNAIIEAGGVLALFSVTDLRLNKISEMTLLALGNICGDCIEYRDKLVSLGFVDLLCSFSARAREIDLGVLRTVAWSMTTVTRGKPGIGLAYVKMLADQLKCLLPTIKDKEVRTDLVWTAANLCDGGQDAITEIIDRGLVRVVLHTLRKSKLKKRIQAALRVVGNISTGTELQAQHLLNEGVLDDLKIFMNKNESWAFKEVLWIISNIAAGTRAQAAAIAEHSIIYCCHEALTSNDLAARKEASYVFKNLAARGSMGTIMKLANQGVVMKLTRALTSHDTATVRNLLELTEKLLEAGAFEVKPIHNTRNFIAEVMDETGLVKVIETLQQHTHPRIYELTTRILVSYFDAVQVHPEELSVEVPSVFAFS
mmetsp:Transcript_16069/g.29455  ORF Transcript_16069/g.29455 Transcript_16069/m.29455 type:complete len:524 (+) Transcript_16069:1-1572(+)